MAQNVTIAGNQYPDVPSILVPKTGGGGNAIFADPSVVTAVAADVASGKYFLNSSGVLTQGTASGGGGASNLVTGTFKGTTTSTAMDVTLNYSGTGFPLVVVIYPKGGLDANTAFKNLVQRYAVQYFLSIKKDDTKTPTYNGNSGFDDACTIIRYKNNATNAGSYANSASETHTPYNNQDSSSALSGIVRIKSATKLSVYISTTSYGFAVNIDFTYCVIYSS